MDTSKSTKKIQPDGKAYHDCFPPNSLYNNFKVRLTGSLSEKNLNDLYKCTLCNHCNMAGLNRSAREIAVSKNLVAPHVARISRNIREFGNPYGIATVRKGERQDIMETILFRGCTPAYKTPEILTAAERLLKRNGVKYGVMDEETCCGNILFNLGDRAAGLEAVRKNIAKFQAAGVKKIVTICPGCYNAFNKYYKGMDGFDVEVVLAVDLANGSTLEGDFIVQDPCHAKEKAGVVRRMLPGARNKNPSPCCGAGAGVITHDRMLATTKAIKAVGKGSTKIVTYCPFCYLNLSSVKPGNIADIYMMLDSRSIDESQPGIIILDEAQKVDIRSKTTSPT